MAILGGTKTLLVAALLVAAIVTDLRTRRVPNRLLLAAFGFFLVIGVALDGVSGLWPMVAALTAGVVCAMPLYLIRAVGAGDVKLIFVISLLTPWDILMTSVVASLAWGALLGVSKALFSKQGLMLVSNLKGILQGRAPAQATMVQIPFTVALFFGFLTATSLHSGGWTWL